MWPWLRDLFASKEPARNKAGDLLLDPRDLTYGVTCSCCETYFEVTGKKVKRCISIPGLKADCPACYEVNFFDRRDAINT